MCHVEFTTPAESETGGSGVWKRSRRLPAATGEEEGSDESRTPGSVAVDSPRLEAGIGPPKLKVRDGILPTA